MLTSEFPYRNFSFFQFNPAQSVVIPLITDDCNLVVSFPTASGKTAIAEAAFGYHLSRNESVAYISPFRSLAKEKYDSWLNDNDFNTSNVVLISGDSPLDVSTLSNSRMAIFTLESFDSKLRKAALRSWFEKLSCVCIDEAQIIGDPNRGGTLESLLMTLTEFFPDIRLILLSGTLGNARGIASWIKSLNDKVTKCCVSSWRPNPLEIDIHVVENEDESDTKLLELLDLSGKTVIFVHSKIVGKKITKKIASSGHRVAFHNASLSAEKRNKIEQTFAEQFSGLNVIVSTSTLGAGVNL